MSEHVQAVDSVAEILLPEPQYFEKTLDPQSIFDSLGLEDSSLIKQTVGTKALKAVAPSSEILVASSVPIDFESMTADARGQEGARFKHVIRGGNRFEIHRGEMSPDEFEAFAVNLLGPDTSLYLHGAHQARRMERYMGLQQSVNNRVFGALWLENGSTRATVEMYRKFQNLVPNYTYKDVKYGILCGFLHDYGEAKLGVDIPLHEKRNPLYQILERAHAVDFAQKIHTPTGSDEDWDILERRYRSDGRSAESPTHQELGKVAMHLHPGEIAWALMGTEDQTHGNVERGKTFEAVELTEYVLTGFRCLEASAFNRRGLQEDEYFNQEILWLGIDSIMTSLAKLTKAAERYVGAYDFLAHNFDQFNKYMEDVQTVIDLRRNGDYEVANSVFGIDPFKAYAAGQGHDDRMTYSEATRKFTQTYNDFKKWQKKEHLVRSAWEAYVGTDEIVGNSRQDDITFLQYTARQRRRRVTEVGKIAIQLPIEDQFGVGLDPAVRKLHEESIYD